MIQREHLQSENDYNVKIVEWLMYFKSIRKISDVELAEKIGFQRISLTSVRNGYRQGSERLLKALENFYQLDNLKQIAELKTQIRHRNVVPALPGTGQAGCGREILEFDAWDQRDLAALLRISESFLAESFFGGRHFRQINFPGDGSPHQRHWPAARRSARMRAMDSDCLLI